MFKIVLRKTHFRDTCRPQTHCKQCFICSWQKNQNIRFFYESVSVVPFHLSGIYWLIYSDYALSESQQYLVYNTHVAPLERYTLILGIMYKMVIDIKLSLFPLFSSKHYKKHFEKVYQTALLSQWLWTLEAGNWNTNEISYKIYFTKEVWHFDSIFIKNHPDKYQEPNIAG